MTRSISIYGLLVLLAAAPRAYGDGGFTKARRTVKQTAAVAAQPAKKGVEAIFLHGLGGAPSHFPLGELGRELELRGMALHLEAPWLRPVELGADGFVRSVGEHTMSDQLARARAAIAKHDGPVVLFGHSFGGKAAIALAKEMPDKVKGVVALAPSVKMLYAYWKNLTGQRGLPAADVVSAKLNEHEARLRGQLAKLAPNAYEARSLRGELSYLETMKDLVRHDETQMELGVAVPMLVLHGTSDQAVSIHYARRFAEANPNVKFVEYEGVGHGLDGSDQRTHRSARKDMAVRIHDFLSSLEQKR